MKLKNFIVKTSCRRICRRAGGLSLGAQLSFPCCLYFREQEEVGPDGRTWDSNRWYYWSRLDIGLLLWEFSLNFYRRCYPT